MKLNEAAKSALRDAGITQAAYARAQGYSDGRWFGDACGCPDDRCIGFHHYANEECGCLPVLLAAMAQEANRDAGEKTGPSTRLPGHGLRAEGKPFIQRGLGRVLPWEGKSGVARCSCGAESPPLYSDAARKRWHRDVHKPEVRAKNSSEENGDA